MLRTGVELCSAASLGLDTVLELSPDRRFQLWSSPPTGGFQCPDRLLRLPEEL